MDKAYYYMPPEGELKFTYDKDGNMSAPAREMFVEIDLHPLQGDTIKKADARTAEFYNTRLITSLNELEKILFSK